jgi:transcriptional regulator with XRE-family HTH domain
LWRIRRGLTQAQAAGLLGLEQSQWSRLEAGHYMPRADEAALLDKISNGFVSANGWLSKAG